MVISMKNTKAALIFMMGAVLCGCSWSFTGGSDGPTAVFVASGNDADGANEEQSDTDDTNAQDEEEPVETVENAENTETVTDCYAWTDLTVIDMSADGEVVYRAGEKESIKSVCGSSELLCILTYSYGTGKGYELSVIDRSETGQPQGETDTLSLPVQKIDEYTSGELSSPVIGYYQDKIYILYKYYDKQPTERIPYAYCYERQQDGSFVKTQDALCQTLMEFTTQEYAIYGIRSNLFNVLNEWDMILVWEENEAKVVSYNVEGELNWERDIDPSITRISAWDGRILVGNHIPEWNAPENESPHYYIYDFAGSSEDAIVKEGDYEYGDGTILTVNNGNIYYCRTEKKAYSLSHYSVYCYDINSGQERLLYETEDVPGQPQTGNSNGKEGFAVMGDTCYFTDFDDGSSWWFSCNLEKEDELPVRLGIEEEYRGYFDLGEITYTAESADCEWCGESLCDYYVEGFQFFENVIPYADEINTVLNEDTEEYIAACENKIEEYIGDDSLNILHSCNGLTCHYTETRIFSGATQYGFKIEGQDTELTCIEARYNAYEDTGGAHGYPYRYFNLFDLSDGSDITIGDIVTVSEEEFRTLAAEYTVADYQDDIYGRFYSTIDEDDLYQEVYEYAGFDCPLLHLSPYGVVVEYSPCHLGPFASSYIIVTIPYEELGVTPVSIYGANE